MRSFIEYKKMQGIAATRVRLGLSQEIFAMELGITRSLLSKAENKQRSLPTTALAKLAALEIALAAETTANMDMHSGPATVIESQGTEQASTIFHYKEMACRAEAERKEFKLAIMLARYNEYRRSLDQLNLLVLANGGDHPRFQPGKLEVSRFLVQQKLNKCDLPVQANLRHKIALLYAEAELHAVTRRAMEGA